MASDTTLTGSAGNDTLITGDGNDTVNGRAGNDYISTGAGDDTIDGGSGSDYILAGAGNDVIQSSGGNDTVDGGAGFDLVQFPIASSNYSFGVVNGRLVASWAFGPYSGSTSLTNVEILSFTANRVTQQVVVATNEDQATAMRLFQGLFDRSPDVEGAAYWLAQVDQGVPLTDIANAFLNSDEFATMSETFDADSNGDLSDEEFIELLYQNALGRSTTDDSDGLTFWTDALANGTTRAEVTVAILGSEEAADSIDSVLLPDGISTSGDDTIALTVGNDTIDAGAGFDVVQVQLGSELASSDYSFSVDGDTLVATNNSDSSLSFALKNTEVLSFGESDDDNVFIVDNETDAEAMRLYQALFDRSPDVEGGKYWLDELDQDTSSLTDVANALLDSDEFASMSETFDADSNGDLSDEEFITLVYENALGREPDFAGGTYWLNALSGDTTRADVVIAIVGSEEAAAAIDSVQIVSAT